MNDNQQPSQGTERNRSDRHQTKSERTSTSDRRPDRASEDPLRDRFRPLWIAIFALALCYAATNAKGQDAELVLPAPVAAAPTQVKEPSEVLPEPITEPMPATIPEPIVAGTATFEEVKDDAVEELPVALPAQRSGHSSQPLVPSHQPKPGRPRYAAVEADLMNNDSDPDPDGWKARVSVMDRNGLATIHRANAVFELVPRVALSDFSGYVNADVKPVRWSSKLSFDEFGVATVELPLRNRIDRTFGWASQLHPAGFHQAGVSRSRQQVRAMGDKTFRRETVITSGINRHTIRTHTIRTHTGMPALGQLTVKISIPGEGVFSAVAIVPMRASVLVDSSWPYR